jgi:hypothetical protein
MTAQISEQLDLAAWEHELRGSHGRWIVGSLSGMAPVGRRVQHPDYGRGQVTDVFEDEHKATVRFKGGKTVDFPYEASDSTGRFLDPRGTIPPKYFGFQPAPPHLDSELTGREYTPNEKTAIEDYVAPGDNALIAGLLRGDKSLLRGSIKDELVVKDAINKLDSAESRHSLAEDTDFHRGIAMTPALSEKMKPGAQFTDPNYTSTSVSSEWADQFARFRSQIPSVLDPEARKHTGTPYHVIVHAKVGQHVMPGEGDLGEWVLPRGSRYQVLARDDTAHTIELAMIQAPPPPAVTELGWRFDPLEHRNRHGEWTRDASTRESEDPHWDTPGTDYKVPDHDRLIRRRKDGSVISDPADHPFFAKHQMSAKNIVDAYHDSTPDERETGKRWYSDAHLLGRMLGSGDADKGAALLSVFSPQTAWPVNMMNAARSIELGHPVDKGIGVTGRIKDTAQAIMDGKTGDAAFPSPKTRAFYRLIRNGGDLPGESDGEVVIDRHALSVAAGKRLLKDDVDGKVKEDQAPVDSPQGYAHIADMYRQAAEQLRSEGEDVSPHQLQAITWQRQQRVNNAEDQLLIQAAQKGTPWKSAKGRATSVANFWDNWDSYAAAHNLDVQHGTTALAGIWGQAIELGFDDHEPRDPLGKWVSETTFYHGSGAKLGVGDYIEPGHDKSWGFDMHGTQATTTNLREAHGYATDAAKRKWFDAGKPEGGPKGWVYEVKPEGQVTRGTTLAEYRAPRWKIVKEGQKALWPGELNQAGILSNSVYDQVIELGLHFDPLQPRDSRGRWSRFPGAREAEETMSKNREGFSVSPRTGESPPGGFMVALEGHTHRYPAEILDDQVKLRHAIDDLLVKEKESFKGHDMYLGGWVEDGKLWLDPSQNVPDRATAERLGKERDQVGIFDLNTFETISTGGSGGGHITDHQLAWPSQGPRGYTGRLLGPDGGREAGGGGQASDGHPQGIAAQAVELGVLHHFNPGQLRGPHGRWVKAGSAPGEPLPRRTPAGTAATLMQVRSARKARTMAATPRPRATPVRTTGEKRMELRAQKAVAAGKVTSVKGAVEQMRLAGHSPGGWRASGEAMDLHTRLMNDAAFKLADKLGVDDPVRADLGDLLRAQAQVMSDMHDRMSALESTQRQQFQRALKTERELHTVRGRELAEEKRARAAEESQAAIEAKDEARHSMRSALTTAMSVAIGGVIGIGAYFTGLHGEVPDMMGVVVPAVAATVGAAGPALADAVYGMARMRKKSQKTVQHATPAATPALVRMVRSELARQMVGAGLDAMSAASLTREVMSAAGY